MLLNQIDRRLLNRETVNINAAMVSPNLKNNLKKRTKNLIPKIKLKKDV
jgi:hypothetical protein